MKNIDGFSDKRHKSSCIHCGAGIANVPANRDHVPTKSILLRPLPQNLPFVTICKKCNSSFSIDEEYFVLFISSILSGSTTPDKQVLENVGRAFTRNPSLRTRLESSKILTPDEDGIVIPHWLPEIERLERIVLKNARGHVFYELGEPMMDEPTHISITPVSFLSEEQILNFETVNLGHTYPEVGSRMMTRLMTGADMENGWIVVQDGVYRYSINWSSEIIIRTFIYEFLLTEVIWGN